MDTSAWEWGSFWRLPPAYAALVIAAIVLSLTTIGFWLWCERQNRREDRDQR